MDVTTVVTGAVLTEPSSAVVETMTVDVWNWVVGGTEEAISVEVATMGVVCCC
ncbi:MAG: hypothetical protein INR62_14025 [Rhodospirillales bacterium]|nr:hypothetical protein [Acetobacter sp.]